MISSDILTIRSPPICLCGQSVLIIKKSHSWKYHATGFKAALSFFAALSHHSCHRAFEIPVRNARRYVQNLSSNERHRIEVSALLNIQFLTLKSNSRPIAPALKNPRPSLELPPRNRPRTLPRPQHMRNLSRNQTHRNRSVSHTVQRLIPIPVISLHPNVAWRDSSSWDWVRCSCLDFVAFEGYHALYGYATIVWTPNRYHSLAIEWSVDRLARCT